MARLAILVPAGRGAPGAALVVGHDGKSLFGPFSILATASEEAARRRGNPARDVRLPYGHIPSGTYALEGELPPDSGCGDASRGGALVLAPTGGDALDALRAGRVEFLLHAGPLDPDGRLRPTFGGLRVSPHDLAALLGAMAELETRGDPLVAVDVVESAGATAARRPPRGSHDLAQVAAVALAVLAAACGPSSEGATGTDDGGVALDSGYDGGGPYGGYDAGFVGTGWRDAGIYVPPPDAHFGTGQGTGAVGTGGGTAGTGIGTGGTGATGGTGGGTATGDGIGTGGTATGDTGTFGTSGDTGVVGTGDGQTGTSTGDVGTTGDTGTSTGDSGTSTGDTGTFSGDTGTGDTGTGDTGTGDFGTGTGDTGTGDFGTGTGDTGTGTGDTGTGTGDFGTGTGDFGTGTGDFGTGDSDIRHRRGHRT